MSRSRGHSPTTSSPGAVGSHASFDRTLLRPDGKRRAASTVVGHDATRERGNSDRREPNPGGGDLARGRLDRAAPSLSPPRSRPPPGHKRDTDFSSHCCGCRFSAALKPYRGAGPALVDLLGGQVQVMFATMSSSIEYVRGGKLRALAVTTATRSPVLPDIPTVAEFVPGYESSFWTGVGAPKSTPPEIVDKLNKEINAALADPKMKARFAELGATALSGSPADFGKLLADETEKSAKVVKFAGVKAD